MGLDIRAYRNLTKLDVIFNEDGDALDKSTLQPVEYDTRTYANPDFPGREEGVEDRAAYKAEESMGFSAGSYMGYGAWREELAKLAGYPLSPVDRGFGHAVEMHSGGAWEAENGPFWELIYFSDCEGVIGPVVSAKLAKDFAEFDERARRHDEAAGLNGGLYERFQLWRQAFEMAADGGLVNFY
ncbi:hypothetical protein [Aeromonas hydrophila]|uniref:hypothetical protein n=1 Tax=Aeromonas hydrophila TaxID=644 RepID=UPI002B472782|nr:hypothetical protein [Aeromonas hydrophila]